MSQRLLNPISLYLFSPDEYEYELVDLREISMTSPLPRHCFFPGDDRNLLGQRLELKWSSGKWYKGTVCSYDEVRKKHFVVYDDGEKKWYHLPEMVFRFIKEDEEWVNVDLTQAL